MSHGHISKLLRQKIARRAKERCGHCLVSALVTGVDLQVEHLWPTSQGGLTVEDNLWLACAECNQRKADRTLVVDPLTKKQVPLFNPRQDGWNDHFRWSDDATEIVGLTAVGRATVVALKLNRPARVATRQRWVSVGWHPPKD